MLGNLKFTEHDSFVDLTQSKVLTEWVLQISTPKGNVSWRGLDILHWRDGKLVLKSTYGKTKTPVLMA